MSREDPLWGSERSRGAPLNLGIAASDRSIRRYRSPRSPRPPSRTWRTSITTLAHALWAAELCVAQTRTRKTLYVLPCITHGRRESVHLAVTAHPTAAWGWRRLVEATPWGRRPTHPLRDRDAVDGGALRERAKALGIETVLTPARAPRANAVAERVMGTLRRERLDHVIPLDAAHLRAILAEVAASSTTERPHRTLRMETPRPQARPRAGPIQAVRARPVLGGLHHAYARAA
jgi:putative transposase